MNMILTAKCRPWLLLIIITVIFQCKSDNGGLALEDDPVSIETSQKICSSLIPGEILLLPPHAYALDKMNRGRKDPASYTYAAWAIDIDRYAHCSEIDYKLYSTDDIDDIMLQTTHAILIDAIKGPIVLPIGSEKQKAFVKREYIAYQDTHFNTVDKVNAYLEERSRATER